MPPKASNDLQNHFKLSAITYPNYTIQHEYRADRARGIRQLKVSTRWDRQHYLGAGGFGEVWLEEVLSGPQAGSQRAVKILSKRQMEARKVDYTRELLALAKFSKAKYLDDKNLLQFHGWFEDPQNVYLAMEYVPLGDLSQWMTVPMGENDAIEIATDLLEGLQAMHDEGFTHRDLKPQNIFVAGKPPISGKWWVKIGDFGITKRAEESTALKTECGTVAYRAPEISIYFELTGETQYTHAVDMWSLGCIIYQLLFQKLPFPSTQSLLHFVEGRSGAPGDLDGGRIGIISFRAKRFVQNLLKPDPGERPTAKEALSASWLLQSGYPMPYVQDQTGSPPPPPSPSKSKTQKVNQTPFGQTHVVFQTQSGSIEEIRMINDTKRPKANMKKSQSSNDSKNGLPGHQTADDNTRETTLPTPGVAERERMPYAYKGDSKKERVHPRQQNKGKSKRQPPAASRPRSRKRHSMSFFSILDIFFRRKQAIKV